MVNKAILVGRLGQDPTTRYTSSGTAVTNFSIATDETYKDRSGERQKRTEWHRIVVWQKLADVCQQYLKKGMLIYIEGRIQTRKWHDTRDNTDKSTTEIVANVMRMLGSKADNERFGASEPTEPESQNQDYATSSATGPEISDEDIPF